MSPDSSIQPEGVEDVAVFTGERLAEVCQVKSLKDPLAVHHLRSARGSFFSRAAAVLRSEVDVSFRIVSFGPIGPELERAVAGDGPERERVVAKLAADGLLSSDEARSVLERLDSVEQVNADELAVSMESRLADLVTGIDAKTSLDLMLFWIYRASEAKRRLERGHTERQLLDVGRYLAERAAHHAEWFTTLEPLSDGAVEPDRALALAAEFHRGMQARWEHILAEVAVPRPRMLGELTEALSSARVVILHGASGQGKSTLAYQFMRELPEAWRFRVRRVDDRDHAARLALLLASFGRTLNLPVYILVDVTVRDSEWAELVTLLSQEPQIRVLVAIREEDWRRTEPSRAAFDFVDVELHELEQSDAAEIYAGLEPVRAPELLDFQHAWSVFGGRGPLLEFVHLVTQGSTLRDVLRKQLHRLQDEARRGERPEQDIRLLRLVAVASAYGARLRLSDVVTAISLPSPARAIELLEREYLIRVDEGGAALAGLHPLRSQMMAELLTDPALESWINTASACLGLVYEEDLESFLLHAFSRRPETRDRLRQAALALVPRSWRGIAGVGRALLWLGIAAYAEGNRELFDRLYAQHGDAYWLFIDWDVAGVNPGVANDTIETMAKIAQRGDELRAAAEAARAQQRPPAELWEPLAEWLRACSAPSNAPSGTEWSDVGQILFWGAHLKPPPSFDDWLREDDLQAAWAEAPLRALADLMIGCHAAGSRHLALLRRARDRSDRMYYELLIGRIDDDGSAVSAHFLVPFDGSTPSGDVESAELHAFTMERVELIRGLWPEREAWGSQGYGHRIVDTNHDTTTKRIPKRNLPVRWLTSVNGTLRGYEEMHRRPADWEQYLHGLTEKRGSATDAFARLADALRRYHRSTSDRVIGYSLDSGTIDQLRAIIDRPLALPRAAVDEWGFVTEASSREAAEKQPPYQLAMRRYQPLVTAHREWRASTTNALQQVPLCLAVEPLLARRARTEEERSRIKDQARQLGIGVDIGPLGSLNVRDAYWRLGPLQTEIRQLFGRAASIPSSWTSERAEAGQYLRFGLVWEHFLARPGWQVMDAVAESQRRHAKHVRELVRDLNRLQAPDRAVRCRVLSGDRVWDSAPAIFVALEADTDAFEQLAAAEAVMEQLRQTVKGTSSLSRRLTALAFRHVVVMLVFRGQLITPEAFVFNVLRLQDDRPLSQLDFVPQTLSTETLSSLGVSVSQEPLQTEANLLLSRIAENWALSSHADDLLGLGTADDRARDVLTEYVGRVVGRLAANIEAAMAHIRRLADWAAGLDESSAADDLQAILGELTPRLVPTDLEASSMSLTVEALAGEKDRLEEARDLALVARLKVADLTVRHAAPRS